MQNSTTLNNKQVKTIRRTGWLHTLRNWLTASAIEEDILAYEDKVRLADGSIQRVPRANLAAAKELLAAQHAAERHMAARDAERTARMG